MLPLKRLPPSFGTTLMFMPPLSVSAEAAALEGVPLFGINRGKLGFLAAYPGEDIGATLQSIPGPEIAANSG